jgi:phage protein D
MPIPWSRALFQISFGGNDVSDRLRPFLILVECIDKAGEVSDTARITVDDQDGRFELPREGDPVAIALGSVGRGVVERFTGMVDTIRSRLDRGGGLTLEITAKGMDTTSGIKEPRQKHLDESTLSDAASAFAKAAGLTGIDVHASLAGIRRPYWAMDDESLIAWGRRTAAEVGGTFKIIGTKGVIVPRSGGVSASGKTLAPITVARGLNLISADLAPGIARPDYGRVRARWYDPKQARWLEKEVELAGASGSTSRQSVTYSRADESDAEKAAGAEGQDSERERGGGRVDIDGEPMALAEAPCLVTGIRPGVDGHYTIETVTDRLARSSGYVTSLDLVRPRSG